MKINTLFSSTQNVLLVAIVSLSFIPSVSEAATQKPTCVLSVETSRGETTIDGSEKVLLKKGEEITVFWDSSNAKKAFAGKEKIDLDGSVTSSPTKDVTYTYNFENGTKKVTCEVDIVVVEGSIKSPLTFSETAKPKITGTAKGLKSVQVNVIKKGETKPVFVKKNVKVSNGKWSVTLSKKLKKGDYTVTLLGTQSLLLNTIATSTLRVGTVAQSNGTTFVAELVPLLVGGNVKGATTVPVMYLQVINIGKTKGTITGFELQQNGNALASTIAGLSIENQIKVNGKIQAKANESLFKNNKVILPVSVTIEPQQMELFTLKATLGTNVASQVGKQLKLDVSSIVTDGKMQSQFPVRGITLTLVP